MKLIYGVGLNDADYEVRTVRCPIYEMWVNMLKRCYYARYLEINPTYQGCSVCTEWHTFSAFRAWVLSQDWEGLCLDKDIKDAGNKLYGPETCLFVSQAINKLLNPQRKNRGPYPTGVTYHTRDKVFHALVRVEGRQIHLGTFDTPEDAATAYNACKGQYVIKTALASSKPEEKAGLLRIAQQIIRGTYYA